MSWSICAFRNHWAHAHDVQQETFMGLAAMYVEADRKYREIPWLRHWQAFWLEAAGNQGNGCSDLAAERHLTDDERIGLFREFLHDYRRWLAGARRGVETAVGGDADRLIAFADLVEAVIDGDETHPKVNRDP